jgi:hypothetical protein
MPEPKPVWYRLHAPSVVAGLLAIFTIVGSNVIGHEEVNPNVPPPMGLQGPECWYAFGWPFACVFREGRGGSSFAQMIFRNYCAFSPGKVLDWQLTQLILDVVAGFGIVSVIVVWVERSCRKAGLGARFGFASMFALVGWFATILARKRDPDGSWDMLAYLWEVQDLLYTMRFLLIGALWFAGTSLCLAFVSYMFRRPAASDVPAKANSST